MFASSAASRSIQTARSCVDSCSSGGEREDPGRLGVAPPGVGLVAVGREALGRDGLDRLEHPESHARIRREPLDQALAGELGEVVEGIEGRAG